MKFDLIKPLILILIPSTILLLLVFGYSWFYSSLVLIACIYFFIKLIENRKLKILYLIFIFGVLALNYFIEIRQSNYYLLAPGTLLIIMMLHLFACVIAILLAYIPLKKVKGISLWHIFRLIAIGFFTLVVMELINLFLVSFILGGIFITQPCSSKIDNYSAIYVLTSQPEGKLSGGYKGIVYEKIDLLMFRKLEINKDLKASDFCHPD